MTELIDLSFVKKKQGTKNIESLTQQLFDLEKFSTNQINRTLEKMIYHIDKNYIKTQEIYFFHLDYAKVKQQEMYWNNHFNLLGLVSVKQNIFTLKLYLLDAIGLKISAKSTYHRTLLSNFVLQVNAQLQNFKLQYNPLSGEFSFVFNVNCQYINEKSVTDLIQYALQCYFEQNEVHFYIPSLIEIINLPQNQFLLNIQEDSQFLKRWLKERRIENNKLKQQLSSMNEQSSFLLPSQKQKRKQVAQTLRDFKDFFFLQSKKTQIQKEPNHNILKKSFRKFKDYYKEEFILSKNLANKTKYKNYLQISAINTPNINNLFSSKLSSKIYQKSSLSNTQNNDLQQKSQNNDPQAENMIKQTEEIPVQTEKLRIWDKNSGKSYLLRLLYIEIDLAKKEEIILQKLCKVDSFLFFNQYIVLDNINLSHKGYITVNSNPNRILLSQFLKNNDETISLIVRFTLCITLLEIFYTLNSKSRITNYFPWISVKNLQITKNLSLSFKYLSKLSVHPLLQLINTLSEIIFQKPLKYVKESKKRNHQIVKGDQISNKCSGISIHINMIKYYLLELYQQSIYLMKVQDLKKNRTNKSQQNQKIDFWTKQALLRYCQQLLVIFNHFKNSLSRGYEDQFRFYEELSDED